MKCFANGKVAREAMDLGLCPYGYWQFYSAKYRFAPETKEEETKLRMDGHKSIGAIIYDYKGNHVFGCSKVIKSVGRNSMGGIYMD